MMERYQIISLIEKDKLGAVYLAQDTTLQRKVIFRSFNKTQDGKKPVGFSQYTGKLCALQHPNLLTIYDISTNEDGYFMVTQFLEGESLEDRLTQGALNQVGVHNMACDLLDALHAAHSSGLFHGALRTDSIKRLPRVRGGHRYLIIDFGQDRLSAMLSGSQVVMADPVLMAPERMGGKMAPDGASDLFTLGQLCYIALVGGHPYAGKSPEECAQAYRDGGLPHLSTYVQGVQSDFANWVMWLVSSTPDQRPFSSQQAMDALHAIQLREPSPNVPGVTEAVNVPAPVNPKLPKISQAIQVATEPDTKASKKAKAKAKPKAKSARKESSKESRLMFYAAGTILCLLVVLILILVFRDDDEVNMDAMPIFSKPKEAMVIMEKPQYISLLLAQRESVKIPLDGGKTIDWTVITGAPASSARVFMKGGSYIRNILAIGEFREFVGPQKMITYGAGGTVIAPQRSLTSSKKGGAKEGEGWEIHLLIPENHKGPLMVTLFMIQNQCDFNLEVRSTHKKNKDKVVQLKIPKSNAGIVKIPLKIAKPMPGYYSIRVLATSADAARGFEMGLSAILLEGS